MKLRVVGLAMVCVIAALGAPSRSGAGPLPPGWTQLAFNSSSGAETFLRRQPAPVNPRGVPTLRRQRRGTISLGGGIGWGFIRGSSELNDHYDNGPGYGLRFRYMLTTRSALAFTFENQHYNTRAGLPVSTDPFPANDSVLVVTTVASEMTIFFHRERETNTYLLAGLGYASPDVKYDVQAGEKESRRVDEGPFGVVGVGLERFVRPRVSLDFALRGFAQVGNSELSLMSQLTAGIHLYPGD